MNCSVTITLIDTGIFLLFPIFQGTSFNYPKPNIRLKKYFDFKGGGCFAKLQMHNGSRPLSFFKIVALNSAYKNLQFYHYSFIKKTLVQACLRAPHVVADEAKLAIVFTYFFLFFSFFFFLLFLRLLLFTHFGESRVRENLFPPIFWHN